MTRQIFSINDYDGCWEEYAREREAYEQYESDLEDRAKEKHYDD
jgi:hypothetical protein